MPATADQPLARFGDNHGYRLDGDAVHLHATFVVLNTVAHRRTWALQLWACPIAPARADEICGHLVAEAWLPPLAEVADPSLVFDVVASAFPPAGTADHAMVLVLAAGDGDRFDAVHDFAVYERRETFILPRLSGAVSYRIDGADRVHLAVQAVENPRDARNVSGTLALELWALREPYAGGVFEGVALAGVNLGALGGQDCWRDLALDLPYAPPPAGTWHYVVMLREWIGSGYRTRDFTNFAEPLTIPAPAAEAPTVGRGRKKPATAAPVSINSATVGELAAVKGMTRAMAEGIVAGRPFVSIEGLQKVRGIGVKKLAALRPHLTL